VTGALYGYQQSNAPRTDQCPPPEAPVGECLTIAAQNRTLGYLALRGDVSDRLEDLELILSWQNHHEVRVKDRPRSFVRFDATDDVDTLGIAFRAATPAATFLDGGTLTVRYGLDGYSDGASSSSTQTFTDLDRTFQESRGQYIEGSSYTNGGVFGELDAVFAPWVRAHAGARLGLVGVRSPGDAASGTSALSARYGAALGRAGIETRPTDDVRIYLNFDQGFRAPNLDDLTSRQQAGPGFQFENAALTPERTNTFELGFRVLSDFLRLEGWGFATLLDDAIVRAVRDADDCPPETPQCNASRHQYQLVNADGTSTIFGAEGGATLYLPADVTLRTTISYAWGEAPNVGSRPSDPSFADARVPLSRIPPLNGTVEGRWRHLATGIYAGAVLRWATDQTRLAPSDRSDARIPIGGTPGYAVVDLRGGFRWSRHARLSLVVENLFDAAYRLHGSSVNAAGRGVLLELMLGL
jgi:iron complex outermembrane receptor protein/hemoglobin/transferrin/lactoferrin receptor protein